MVNGASPGPAPVAQARASSSRLTWSSCRTWPHRKLLRKVARVKGALTLHPSTRPVLLERSASASSMQSPPANAEATRVISLSPVLARPRTTEVEVIVHQLTQAEIQGQGGRKDQPGIVDPAVIVEGELDAVEVLK